MKKQLPDFLSTTGVNQTTISSNVWRRKTRPLASATKLAIIFLLSLTFCISAALNAAISEEAFGIVQDDHVEEERYYAERLLTCLKTNQDQQGEKAAELVEAFVDDDRLEDARYVARFVKGWRSTAAFYMISEQAAHLGKNKLSDESLAQAEAGDQGVMDNEKEGILVQRVKALAARGELAKAREGLPKIISPAIRNDVEAHLFEFEPAKSVAKKATEFAAREEIAPSARGRALLLGAQVLEKAGRKKEAISLAEKGIEALCRQADVDTIPILHNAVKLLVRFGNKEEAARWAEVCVGFAERTDVRAYWKTRDMWLAAKSLRAVGMNEKAHNVLRQIPDLVHYLDPMSYSRGGMFAAGAFISQNKPAMFHEAAKHVLKMTRKHPHHRARAMAGVDVLAGYIRNDLTIPAEVRDEFTATMRSVEGDSAFLNPL
jgi:hypothetical protein